MITWTYVLLKNLHELQLHEIKESRQNTTLLLHIVVIRENLNKA